jgi:hypothetical protein
MSYKIAGIDVHKKVLVVEVMDASTPDEKPERRRFGTLPSELRRLIDLVTGAGVEEAVMESTAQYWQSVWLELEPCMRLHLAQAFSSRAPRGRKHDFKDDERLVRRLIANELILSFVPDGEQRTWRSMTRMKVQLTPDRGTTAEPDGVSARRDADQAIDCRVQTLISQLRQLPGVGLPFRQDPQNAKPAGAQQIAPCWVTTGAAAVDRHANRQAQRQDRAGREAASRGGDALGGSTWIGSGFGATDHRGSGRASQHVPFGGGVDLLGGNLSRKGRKCRREQQ